MNVNSASSNRYRFFQSFFVLGPFKDVFLHPSIRWVTKFVEEFVMLDFFMGEPVLPVTTIVIILFMVQHLPSSSFLSLIYIFS